MARPIAYMELAAELREAIRRGAFAPGQRMPTEAELTEQRGLSRQTVRRALQDLVAEGLVYRVRGRGTFATSVAPGNRYLRSFGSVEDLLAFSVDTVMETIEPLVSRANVETAGRLQLPSDQVMIATARRKHDGAPFCVTSFAFSVEIGRRVAHEGILTRVGQITQDTAISVVDRVAPSPIAGAHQSITAVPLPDACAALLGRSAGEPALRIDRLYYDVGGRPLELAVSHFSADRYTYRVELSRKPNR